MNIDERVYGYEPAQSELMQLRAEIQQLRDRLTEARMQMEKQRMDFEWAQRDYAAAVDLARAFREELKRLRAENIT